MVDWVSWQQVHTEEKVKNIHFIWKVGAFATLFHFELPESGEQSN
jgi:hypothetical protein